MVEKASSLFLCVPLFLKTYLVAKAPANDLSSRLKRNIQLGKALVESLHPYSWYLTEDLIIPACADNDIEEDVKLELLKLGNCHKKK